MEDKTYPNLSIRSRDEGVTPYASPVVLTDLKTEEEELSLSQAWSIVKHRLLLVGLIAAGVTAAAAAWTFQKTPIYEGKFQLLVGEPIAVKNQSETSILESLSTGQIDYDTQIEVLRSDSILQPIIDQWDEKYPDIEYKQLVGGGNNAPLQVEQLKDTKILKVIFRDQDPEKIKFITNSLAQAYLAYSLEERKVEINQGIDFVNNQLPQLRAAVDQHQSQLQSFRQRYNLVDPEQKAQELTDQLYTLESEYFDAQVRLNETQSLYAALQQQIGLNVDNAISSTYLSEAPRYQALLNELQAVELELAKESTRFSDENPIIQALKEKRDRLLPLVEAEAQNALGDRFDTQVSDSPALASPSQLRQTLNQQYVEAANQLKIYQLRYQALGQEIEKVKQQLLQMPALSRRYTELQRELRIATESLDRLLEAQQTLQIDGAQKNIPWQLISQPVVGENPVYPKPIRNIALGLMGGLGLGVAAAFLAEKLDPVFHSLDDVKEQIDLPLLGVIPIQKELKSVEKALERSLPKLQIGNYQLGSSNSSASSALDTLHRSSRAGNYKVSGFLEAFRSLNTNIWLLGSESNLKSFVVSSPSPGDGKSTISTHLAQAAAAMGQRVLIVDADLRRPQVHRQLNIENEQGLSNVLATGLNLEEAIQPIPQWENLSVLTAGDIPPDPTRLLASGRMQQIMEQLRSSDMFDIVIYDTPPMANFADARILGTLTNGIIMVVRVGKTDRSTVKHTLDDLKMANVPLLGFVSNAVQRGGLGSYYDYYYYYGRRS